MAMRQGKDRGNRLGRTEQEDNAITSLPAPGAGKGVGRASNGGALDQRLALVRCSEG